MSDITLAIENFISFQRSSVGMPLWTLQRLHKCMLVDWRGAPKLHSHAARGNELIAVKTATTTTDVVLRYE